MFLINEDTFYYSIPQQKEKYLFSKIQEQEINEKNRYAIKIILLNLGNLFRKENEKCKEILNVLISRIDEEILNEVIIKINKNPHLEYQKYLQVICLNEVLPNKVVLHNKKIKI